MTRRETTRAVKVGPVAIGGGSDVVVQSMTNTLTRQVEATVKQITALADAGAKIVRVAVPTGKDTAALPEIVAASSVPIVADVHFHFDRAIEAIEAGVAKIRLNPGNLRDRDALKNVIAAARSAGIPIRIGINAGSIRRADQLDEEFTDEQMLTLILDEMTAYVKFFEQSNFDDLVLSAKSSDVPTTIALYRAMADTYDYPLHVGLTHSGTVWTGSIRSGVALGVVLADGIGDTIRVSLAGDPVREVHAAYEILETLGLHERDRPELIVCPTCGRCRIDLAAIADQVERRLEAIRKPVKVAVMGCVVNGPGEAADADVALVAGRNAGFIYRNGRRLGRYTLDNLVDALIDEVENDPPCR